MTKKTTKRAKKVKSTKRQIQLPRSVRRLFPQVTSAVDSTKAVHVSVNKQDCDDAEELNPMDCALARATKREMKADGVIIGMSSSYIIRGKQAVRFATPMSVQKEIVSFDRHHDFAPGEYHLTPKSPSQSFGESRKKERDPKRSHDEGARRVHHNTVRVRVLAKGVSNEDAE